MKSVAAGRIFPKHLLSWDMDVHCVIKLKITMLWEARMKNLKIFRRQQQQNSKQLVVLQLVLDENFGFLPQELSKCWIQQNSQLLTFDNI